MTRTPRALLVVVSCGLCILAAICSSAQAQAPTGTPATAPSPCAAALARPEAAMSRAGLAALNYRCVALASGQHLWVGEQGATLQPTVLLVHGLGSNAHLDWQASLDAIARQGLRVLAVDLPGFGGSPAPVRPQAFAALGDNLAELLDLEAPGQRVHVVGHSLGAAVSLSFAHRHPARVSRLVLADAAGILLKPVFAQHIASVPKAQSGFVPLDRLLGFIGDRITGLSRLLFMGPDGSFDFMPWLARNPEARQALLGGMSQVDAAVVLVEHDFTSAIRETTAPTTVIWGRNDRVAPPRTGLLLARRLPDARLRVIDGAGHTPMLEQPAAFNDALASALTGPWPQRPSGAMPVVSQGHVVCRNTDDVRYTGRFDSITLESCGNVRIDKAWVQHLKVVHSDVQVDDSVIDSPDGVAIDAQRSEVTATAVQVRGRVAIRTDNSFFDLAGVSLQADTLAVDMAAVPDKPAPKPSRLFLSVSDWKGTDYTGDAHFIWPRPGTAR